MTQEKKLEVLSLIANKLNESKITWSVGGSLLLFLNDKIKTFNDIDLMVTEEDAIKTDEILSELGIKLQTINKYKTKYFLEYIINDVEVDVVAGMIIDKDDKEYYCPLTKEEIIDYCLVNGQKIPMQSLEKWKYIYELMGNEEKAKLI